MLEPLAPPLTSAKFGSTEWVRGQARLRNLPKREVWSTLGAEFNLAKPPPTPPSLMASQRSLIPGDFFILAAVVQLASPFSQVPHQRTISCFPAAPWAPWITGYRLFR